jgi:iron complex outermembrane receptor protein
MKLKPLTVLCLSTLAALPEGAIAQNRATLEEIIVTAQKREEAIQDVPIAISAFGADALEKQGISNLEDFQGGQVPSLKVVSFAGRPNTIQIGIRGITESDPTQLTVERPIAVYVDGVYIARGNGMDTEVFDIERMEVLRGPQGTLFGRNAMGGALNITTRKPKGEFGFKQELEASSLDEYKSRTLIDTPEFNGLSASLGYLHRQANGWINNPGGKEDFNWQDKDAYRIALQYQADSVVVDYSYDHTEIDFTANYPILLDKPAASFNPRPAGYGRPDSAWNGTLAKPASTTNEGHSLTVEWSINDSLTFKSVSGYRDLDDYAEASGAGANAFVPGAAFAALGLTAFQAVSDNTNFATTTQDQFSQEFQLIGDTDRLEWQVGAMYFHEDGAFTNNSDFGYLYNGCNPLAGYGASCGQPVLSYLFASRGIPRATTQADVDTDSYGLFAQATWNPDILDDRLKITAGLRYGNDDKDIHRPLQNNLPVSISANASTERLDPALTIAWQLLDETSIYARYSTAYRGGGVSVREVNTFTPFEEEEIESAEVGLKSVFWDNRARINAALFYNEIDNFVVSVQQVCTGCTTSNTVLTNADGKARMHGGELDASVLIMDGLTLSVAYTYLDNSIPPALDNGVVRQPSLNNAPRNSWAVNIDYAFEPFSFGQLDAHLDVTDSDEYCFNPFSCRQDAVMAQGDIAGLQGGDDNRLINARLTLSRIAMGQYGELAVALWGKNLTDEEYLSYGYTAPAGTNLNAQRSSNNTVGQYGDPRSVGMTMTYQY